MIDYQCHPLIRLPAHMEHAKLGGRRDLIVTGPQCLSRGLFLKGKGSSFSIRGDAIVGIYERSWLLMSWDPLTPLHPGSGGTSQQLVERDEPGGVVWYGRARGHMTWRKNAKPRLLVFRITQGCMDSMYEDYGDPEGEGAALAMRLMPRRSPGVIRLYEDVPHIFLWVPLF